MASGQTAPAVQQQGPALPGGMTQQAMQEIVMVRPPFHHRHITIHSDPISSRHALTLATEIQTNEGVRCFRERPRIHESPTDDYGNTTTAFVRQTKARIRPATIATTATKFRKCRDKWQ